MSRWIPGLISAFCVVVVSSCASINVNALPQPGTSYSDGYDIIIEFDNVLNLPDRTKVVMDGTTVGVVSGAKVGSSAVDVTARIARSVNVPSDIRAVLQQASVLGDIYVALDTAPVAGGNATPLRPGGRIPLAQTTSPPQLEDTIANLATFVTSGTIQRVQNTIIGINRITPERSEELRAMASRVSEDLSGLSDNIDNVDLWFNGLSDTVHHVAVSIPDLQYWFSPTGMLGFERIFIAAGYIGRLFPSIGSVYTGGFWLMPMLDSLVTALGTIQKSKWAVEGEYAPWRRLFTDVFLPEDKYPAMNITSIQTPDGREISGNVQEVLRMLGAVP